MMGYGIQANRLTINNRISALPPRSLRLCVSIKTFASLRLCVKKNLLALTLGQTGCTGLGELGGRVQG